MTTFVDFAALIEPITIDEFAREYLGVRPYVATRPRHESTALFGWTDLNDLLASAEMEANPGARDRIEVWAGDRRLGPDDLCRPASPSGARRAIDSSRLTHALRSGAQLVVHEVDVTHRAVGRLAEDVARRLHRSISAWLSAVWQAPLTTRFETAEADLLILQLQGRQRWKTRQASGSSGGDHHPEAQILECGSIAYVPVGWSFRNTPLDLPSVHLFLKITPPTTGELVEWVAARLLEADDGLREALPDDPAERIRTEKALLERLATACEDPALLERFAMEWDAAAVERRAWLGLPWTATKAVLPGPEVTLRLNGPRFPVTRKLQAKVEFRMRGARFELDETVAMALAPLFAGQSVTVGQLLSSESSDSLRAALIDLLLAGHVVPDERSINASFIVDRRDS